MRWQQTEGKKREKGSRKGGEKRDGKLIQNKANKILLNVNIDRGRNGRNG